MIGSELRERARKTWRARGGTSFHEQLKDATTVKTFAVGAALEAEILEMRNGNCAIRLLKVGPDDDLRAISLVVFPRDSVVLLAEGLSTILDHQEAFQRRRNDARPGTPDEPFGLGGSSGKESHR